MGVRISFARCSCRGSTSSRHRSLGVVDPYRTNTSVAHCLVLPAVKVDEQWLRRQSSSSLRHRFAHRGKLDVDFTAMRLVWKITAPWAELLRGLWNTDLTTTECHFICDENMTTLKCEPEALFLL